MNYKSSFNSSALSHAMSKFIDLNTTFMYLSFLVRFNISCSSVT